MKERIVDEQIRLVPYYRNDAVSLRWYQDAAVCKQIDNRDTPYALALLHRMYEADKAKLAIKKKYGKNAILKAMNLEEGATAKGRNAQIGGHKT